MRKALALLILVIGLVATLSARMGPSVLMIYGGTLRQPVFILVRTAADLGNYATFTAGRSLPVEPAQYTERPYFNIAMFWGVSSDAATLATLKPEQAHQHGRLYVATKDVGAAAVSTAYMELGPRNAPMGTPLAPLARPIPTSVSEFKYGAWLTDADVAFVEKLGVRVSAPSVSKYRSGSRRLSQPRLRRGR